MFNSIIIHDGSRIRKLLLTFNTASVGHLTRRLFVGLSVERVVKDLSDQFDAKYDFLSYVRQTELIMFNHVHLRRNDLFSRVHPPSPYIITITPIHRTMAPLLDIREAYNINLNLYV